jgi:hypothetical protein
MTNKQNIKNEVFTYFKYTLGSGSHMNLFGKIVFAPLVIFFGFFFGLTWFTLEFLFTKKESTNDK